MIAGLSGSLLSHDLLVRLLDTPADDLLVHDGGHAIRRLRAWHAAARGTLGPASTPRQIYDLLAAPLLDELGFASIPVETRPDLIVARLSAAGEPVAVLVVTVWGQTASAMWRHAVHHALAHRTRWCFGVTGDTLRIFDADRAYARRYAAFDLDLTLDDERAARALWGILHASALRRGREGARLDRVASRCERHRVEVGASLRAGVHDALMHLVAAFRQAARRGPATRLLDESLIVIYRILFLLFAEARRLVPQWHPVYRESYTIGALQEALERHAEAAGVWEALQAIARLAHRGCRAGALQVPAFNGRLFSPAEAPLADTLPLDDRTVGEAIRALTVRRGRSGLERISYGDLGVEQLGSVYEHLLDFDLSTVTRDGPSVLVSTGRRKATGSFYTPRSLTEFLVRRTLAPLVSDAAPEAILQLRVLDPAMGSGAFLVAACRYLAAAYEQALIRHGERPADDIDAADRATFRRLVAQRCLFGVDANPMAVQLGRLSLWLATLSGDRPLTFLDHHLRTGNSLIGASMQDVLCRTPADRAGRAIRSRDLPLFASDALQASLKPVVGTRLTIAGMPDDSLAQVREKEQLLSALGRPGGPLERWRAAANLWCSAFCAVDREIADRGVLRALLDRLLRADKALPEGMADRLLSRVAAAAEGQRFFHWTLEFPEVFHDASGTPPPRPGFDAILGNPPWDMLRDDHDTSSSRTLAAFVRRSGTYLLLGGGHGNLYQLFLERALQLLKRGGRAGFILPAGFAADHTCAALRRHVFTHTTIDSFTMVENRDGLFPIHRGLKFLLLTLTGTGTSSALPLRSGIRTTPPLDRIPDAGLDPSALPVPLTLITRVSGESLAVPAFQSPMDVEIVSRIAVELPVVEDAEGWQLRFGRELNVTDDRPAFTSGRGLPVLEGKQMQPFTLNVSACRFRIPAREAARRLPADKTFRRPRLAYREVAAATNRLTLIAAIVPAGVVTSHTVFCLKTDLDEDAQQFLCGIFNSYVANYLVRLRVGTHVTAAIIARLPVPKPLLPSASYTEIVRISRRLARTPDAAALARLNALVALEYGLSSRQFAHVLDTFPLVSPGERRAAMEALATC